MAIDQAAVATQETYQEAAKDESSLVRLWLDAIAIADSEEKDWRKQAQECVDLYRQSSGDPSDRVDDKKKFNILHSNIETLLPALYNSTPIPDVRRRFNDPDPIAKKVSDIQERALSYSIDAYDFDHVMRMASQDNELTGRGVTRVRYLPYVGAQNTLDYQELRCEHVPWKHFRRGPGNTWDEVTWEAFELFLTREELLRLSPELGADVGMDIDASVRNDKGDGRNTPEVFKRARVWEIWDKERREVIFIAPSYKEKPIRREPDPLGVEGFFCTPRPLYAISTSDSLIPVVPYEIYRAQAEELERVSERILTLTEAVKARAIYDGRLESEMERMAKGDDTDNVPVQNLAVFADGSKLSDHIMWYPVEVIVAALEKLYIARDQIKQTIYEITGISDILRGETNPNETLGAQQIKTQWGSLRIQNKQREIQRYARDLFRIKAELFATKFQPNILEMMTGIGLVPQPGEPQESVEQKQAVLQLMQSDKMRGFKVDVESDSTIRADQTRNQQNMTQFLQGTAQFAQSMGPIVMTFKEMTPAVIDVYTAFARNFKLGRQAEDALDAVSDMARQAAQQPKPPPPEQQEAMAKMQLEQAKLQADVQAKAAQLQLDTQKAQADIALEREKMQMQMQLEREKCSNDMAMRNQEHHDEMTYKSTKDDADREARSKPTATVQFDGNEALGGLAASIAQAVESNSNMMAQAVQALAQVAAQSEKTSQAVLAAAKMMALPKRVIRDRQGRVTGAEPISLN